jgi:DegV family protein with EDD domain
MPLDFQKAFVAGVERVFAWADLLDAINVYPVADGDTGRNLVVSLAPLRRLDGDCHGMTRTLLLSARGNSGNIASRFLSSFIRAETLGSLVEAAEEGRRRAWLAVKDPRPGTMLTLFDALVEILGEGGQPAEAGLLEAWGKKILARLEETVRSTPELLPKLKQAGVVDAGALGMFLYFEGFLHTLLGMTDSFRVIPVVFKGQLKVSEAYRDDVESGYCVDAVLSPQSYADAAVNGLSMISDSIVVTRDADYLKVHLHPQDRELVRRRLSAMGELLTWADDDLGSQTRDFERRQEKQAMHIMTDAAGSVTRQDARMMGITLLNSYITSGETCLPETHFQPMDIYAAMRQGKKVVTSQASVFERHQLYESVLSRFERVLYLCVGSVFTGNYDVATAWKKEHDQDGRMLILDTAAASGRLGLVAIACARLALQTDDPAAVARFARQAIQRCEEYIFLDKLQYLAAGGRLSRTGAFFGDILRMKPIISPQAEGAKKVGVVKSREKQIGFALDRLARSLRPDAAALVMLEYSDNQAWVEETVRPEIVKRFPRAEIILQPLSLTSGVHMGPGTWGVAFLPQETSIP